jgi:hypothetical protein
MAAIMKMRSKTDKLIIKAWKFFCTFCLANTIMAATLPIIPKIPMMHNRIPSTTNPNSYIVVVLQLFKKNLKKKKKKKNVRKTILKILPVFTRLC